MQFAHFVRVHVQALSTFGGTKSHLSPLQLMTDTIREDGSTNGRDIPFSPIPLALGSDSSDEIDDAALATVHAGMDDGIQASVPEEGSGRKSKDGSRKRPSILHLPGLPQTSRQIFAHAYGEIEKEKAAFSSSSHGHDIEAVAGEYYGAPQMLGKLRPPIELSFVDLSLFLKGSGRKILSNVTGKLTPGRVTAVMGPSGAGKTTFLNACAGGQGHAQQNHGRRVHQRQTRLHSVVQEHHWLRAPRRHRSWQSHGGGKSVVQCQLQVINQH